MSNLQQALQSKDFQSAPRAMQMKYLASVDPDYASAKPEDQMAYLNHITGKPAPTTANNEIENKVNGPNEGFLRAAVNDVKGLFEGLTHAGEMTSPGSAIAAGGRLAQDYTARQQEGRSPLYNAAATAVSATPIMNTRPMEMAANRGDAAGVVGHTAVPIAQAVTPSLLSRVPEAAGAAVQRIARGPGGSAPVAMPLPEWMRIPGIERELESRIPRNEPPGARDLMYNDLASARMRRGLQQDALDKKAMAVPQTPTGAAGVPESSGVMHVREPRPTAPGEKPGAMYSIPRELLEPLARTGKPGALDTLRDLGRKAIVIPEGAGDFPGPRERQLFPEDENEEQ